MTKNLDFRICFGVMAVLTLFVGIFQSWGLALSILNLCLISAVMSMGVNIQWGFAGLINFGVMGFLAVGGLATVLVSVPPVYEAWSAGGLGILISGLFLVFIVFFFPLTLFEEHRNFPHEFWRPWFQKRPKTHAKVKVDFCVQQKELGAPGCCSTEKPVISP